MTNTTQDEALYRKIMKAIEKQCSDFDSYDGETTTASLNNLEKAAKAITDICNREKVRFAKELSQWLGENKWAYSNSANTWYNRGNSEAKSGYVSIDELIEQFSFTTNKGI